jgi:hypothetical protein
MLSVGLWRWYINITITVLDIIRHLVYEYYIKTRRFGDWILSPPCESYVVSVSGPEIELDAYDYC